MDRRTFIISTGSIVALTGCVSPGGGGGSSHGGGDRLDESGTMEVVIDGSEVDLTEDRFQAEHADDYAMAFHFHEFDEYWYMEGTERVTFAEAVDHIPHFSFDADGGDFRITYDGTVYDRGEEGTEMTFLVDDEEVDPTEYELQDGDHLHLEITTDG